MSPDIVLDVKSPLEQQMNALGFEVWATTTFEDGVSFDAHDSIHTKLVRGAKMATAEEAMQALYEKCTGSRL